MAVGDDLIDQLQWDEEDYSDTLEQLQTSTPAPQIRRSSRERRQLLPGRVASPTNGLVHEATPLLRKAVSFHMAPHPRRASTSSTNIKSAAAVLPEQASLFKFTRPDLPRRRSSTSSSQSGKHIYGGQSTFGQTVSMILFPWCQERKFKSSLTALQLHSNPGWYWHVVRASSFCLLGLDHWDGTYCVLWFYLLLYVCLVPRQRYFGHQF
jgi:hypothetical protein